MKSPDGIVALLGSIVILAVVTTLVLPNRQTAKVISAGGSSFAGAIRAAMGQK